MSAIIEDLVNPYCPKVANKLNFFMDLEKFPGLSYKGLFAGDYYKASARVVRGLHVTNKEMDGLVNVVLKYQEDFYTFVNTQPEDTKEYRIIMKNFIDKFPFHHSNTFKTKSVLMAEYEMVYEWWKRLSDLYLKFNDLFIDNPF